MPESEIHQLIFEILSKHLTESENKWLGEQKNKKSVELLTAFVAVPRFINRRSVTSDNSQTEQLNSYVENFSVNGWDTVRLARVALLTCLDSTDQEEYLHAITTLFDTAEMNELVALYSALPLLSFPEKWLFRATDAVRSNIGFVLDAIALQNPYPARYFPEAAWNQLILKTIFNDKPIHLIVGLEKRANPNLALTLSDFAHERWAAGRSVAPQVWRLIVPFVNDQFIEDLRYLANSEKKDNQQAAALVCYYSENEKAGELLKHLPELKNAIEDGTLSWKNLEVEQINTYQ